MHFTGMNALELDLNDGTRLQIDFELGLTVLSFTFATMGVLVGLKIASSDPFFLEIQAERRKLMLVSIRYCALSYWQSLMHRICSAEF